MKIFQSSGKPVEDMKNVTFFKVIISGLLIRFHFYPNPVLLWVLNNAFFTPTYLGFSRFIAMHNTK